MLHRTKQWLKTVLGFYRLDPTGFIVGVIFYCFALTPSLIPRTAFLTGLIAGISFAVGYGVGILIELALRKAGIPTYIPKRYRHRFWLLLAVIAVTIWLAFGFMAAGWQNEVRKLVGMPTLEGFDLVTIWFWALVSSTISLLIARGIGRGHRWIRRQINRVIPRRVSTLLSLAVTITLGLLLLNGVLFRGFRTVSNNIFRAADDRTDSGVSQPESPLRTGSSASYVPWKSLGRQGRTFVGSGPSEKDFTKFHDATVVKDSIRIYVGADSATTTKERAKLAVRELKRTGAFERKVLVVATPTGTGWLEPEAVDSIEYLWGGDTAIVATQYSYLPSWISFLVDQANAADTGRMLFEEVYNAWKQLPSDQRPKLYAYGLSLGSFGSQAAFSGASDLANRVDGAIFVGSPNFSQPWRYLTENRDTGTHEILPTYKGGQTVRFATTGLVKTTDWQQPRVLYLQHASDPVVWWGYNLIWHQPDWLKEPRGSDVTSRIRWYPFVTFLQVTIDQVLALDVPSGHGHDYADTMPDAWSTISTPSDWTSAKATELRELISAYNK